jgi:hypothetical protein
MVMYWCETWSLILQEKQRQKVLENKALKRIFGPMHNEELNNLYSSLNIIRMFESRKVRWAGHVAQMGRRGMHEGCWWKSRKEETIRENKM